jgi:hypothetical protein
MKMLPRGIKIIERYRKNGSDISRRCGGALPQYIT